MAWAQGSRALERAAWVQERSGPKLNVGSRPERVRGEELQSEASGGRDAAAA